MAAELIGWLFPLLAGFFGGVEPAGLILLILVGIYAYIQRASLPTVFFSIFLVSAALFNYSNNGAFMIIFGLTIVAGAALLVLGSKQQFSQV